MGIIISIYHASPVRTRYVDSTREDEAANNVSDICAVQ
jgi:hypothetical protein